MATAAVNRSDEQIQKDVLSKLKWDAVVRPNAVGMAVKDGEVPLRSWVDSYTYRRQDGVSLQATSFRGHVVKHPQIHALIIGGGVAGQALSLFLNKVRLSSTVFEAYPCTEGSGGGLNVAPNGMNVLNALGLAEKVKMRGTVTLESCFRSETGRVLARIDNGSKKYGQSAVSMRRTDLHAVPAKEMQRQGIGITYHKRLSTVSHTASHAKVVAHFADGSRADGDILIGADGIHSQTRKSILPENPNPEHVGIIGIGGFVPSSAVPSLPTVTGRVSTSRSGIEVSSATAAPDLVR